jgi:hypothetical protein
MKAMKRLPTRAISLLLTAAFMLAGSPVLADETEIFRPEREVDEDTDLEFYGWISKAILIHDDGTDTETYPLVDSDTASTRFGMRFRQRLDDGLKMGVNVEVEWEPFSTVAVDQASSSLGNTTVFDLDEAIPNLRKAELLLQLDSVGRLSLGNGASATDGVTQADLSGTILAGHSSASAIAGGPFLTFDNGARSDLRWRDVISNFDGFCCMVRARYDSPEFAGLRVSASWGEDLFPSRSNNTVTEFAIRHNATSGGFQLKGSIGYRASEAAESDVLLGSYSALHESSGLSVTLAGAVSEAASGTPKFIYLKTGWQGGLITEGRTAFSLSVYRGGDQGGRDTTSTSVGLQSVQKIDALSLDLFASVNWYRYDATGASFNDAWAYFTGVRWSF